MLNVPLGNNVCNPDSVTMHADHNALAIEIKLTVCSRNTCVFRANRACMSRASKTVSHALLKIVLRAKCSVFLACCLLMP